MTEIIQLYIGMILGGVNIVVLIRVAFYFGSLENRVKNLEKFKKVDKGDS